jgi:hypothetical protein
MGHCDRACGLLKIATELAGCVIEVLQRRADTLQRQFAPRGHVHPVDLALEQYTLELALDLGNALSKGRLRQAGKPRSGGDASTILHGDESAKVT